MRLIARRTATALATGAMLAAGAAQSQTVTLTFDSLAPMVYAGNFAYQGYVFSPSHNVAVVAGGTPPQFASSAFLGLSQSSTLGPANPGYLGNPDSLLYVTRADGLPFSVQSLTAVGVFWGLQTSNGGTQAVLDPGPISFNGPQWSAVQWLQFGAGSTRLTIVVTLTALLVSTLVVGLNERIGRVQAQAIAAEREAAEQRLKLLQAQLEPHMLFNTLANLRVLIETEPAAAQAMLDRLIAYLRATLGGSRSAWHPLADEYARLDDYLALMRVRMGARLAVELELPAELREVPVPPLLLQPLVENSIRHGLEPSVAGGRLAVAARLVDGHLRLTVRDTGVGLGASPMVDGSHFGIEQVRSRLATLYGDRARFTLAAADDGDGGTLATIDLPQRA